MTVLQLAIKLLIYIGVGFFARKRKIMADGFDRMLTKFLMAVPLPCMIINSFRLEFSVEQLMNCPKLIGLAILGLVLCFLIGQIIYLAMGKSSQGKAARFAMMFTNFTFFGFAVVSELYGTEASFNYVIFTLPVRIAFYGGAPMLIGARQEGVNVKETLKQFLSVPVVAVFLGLVLYVTQLQLPEVISSVMTSLGNMASPLGLMLCGVIIADASFSGIRKYPSVFWLTGLRLIAVPGLMLAVFLLLGVDHDVIQSLNYYFAMPVATFLPTFFLRYAPEDVEGRTMSGFLVVASTLACVVTIPLWAMVLEQVLA
jgi:predicted permease